jgi:hypothetical protein
MAEPFSTCGLPPAVKAFPGNIPELFTRFSVRASVKFSDIRTNFAHRPFVAQRCLSLLQMPPDDDAGLPTVDAPAYRF